MKTNASNTVMPVLIASKIDGTKKEEPIKKASYAKVTSANTRQYRPGSAVKKSSSQQDIYLQSSNFKSGAVDSAQQATGAESRCKGISENDEEWQMPQNRCVKRNHSAKGQRSFTSGEKTANHRMPITVTVANQQQRWPSGGSPTSKQSNKGKGHSKNLSDTERRH